MTGSSKVFWTLVAALMMATFAFAFAAEQRRSEARRAADAGAAP